MPVGWNEEKTLALDDKIEEFIKINCNIDKKECLRDICQKYPIAEIIGTISKKGTYFGLSFAKTFVGERVQCREIKTIGTFYYRMYNGGTEKVVSLLASIWVELGYNVVLFTDEEENDMDYVIPDSVKRIVLKNGCKNTPIQNYKMRADELGKQLQDNCIDIMIYHAWQEPLLLWDLMLVKGYNIPFLLYTHGVFATIYHVRDRYANVINDVYRLCDKIICLTEVSYEYYRMLGCNVSCVQNPADKALYDVRQSKLDSQDILWIGRISGEKRPEDALEIYKEVAKVIPNAQLYIVGEGDKNLEKKIKKEIQTKGYSDKVHWCGYQDNVGKFYEKAAVMLLTSDFEGYCLTLLESKAYGVPCVMYELPYLSLTKGKRGICDCEIGDIKAMSTEVVKLLVDTDLRKEKGREARENFEAIIHFDQKKCWKDIFEELMNNDWNAHRNNDTEMMLRLLIEQNNIGIQRSISQYKDSLEYKIGYRLMYFPRKVWNYLWRVTHKSM